MVDLILSPYITFVLSLFVLAKWINRAIHYFKWSDLGAIASRFTFTLLYAIVIIYNPYAEDLRNLVRIGLNLLFLDEIINWGISNTRRENSICDTLKSILKKINHEQ